MLARLRHPNVCLFMGACFDKDAPHWALVTEYISQGSLWDALRPAVHICCDFISQHVPSVYI